MKIFCRKTIVLTLNLLLFLQGYAQRMDYEVTSDSTIYLKAVYNEDKNNPIDIVVDGLEPLRINANGSLKFNKNCCRFVKANYPTAKGQQTKVLWRSGDTADAWKKLHPDKVNVSEEKDVKSPEPEMKPVTEKSNDIIKIPQKKVISVKEIISMFNQTLEKDSFYSSMYVQALNDEVAKHSELMGYVKDRESREEYIQKYLLRENFKEKENAIKSKEDSIDLYIDNFIFSNYNVSELPDRADYDTKLYNILEEKISERKRILDNFRGEIFDEDFTMLVTKKILSGESIGINVVVVLLVVCLIVLIVRVIRKANKKKKSVMISDEIIKQNAQSDIIVRRKTTSILKKQSLEDVQHNNSYLKIECADFCVNSAVRCIYLKNTCIKDIYNMYAEDLRNPDNPNEDGCMVLGRWVHNEQNDEYDVSLEEIVKPGDDAIFKEYELNFGGKIKLKVSESLRRLRRETNLQYDMTCWVHSHPGLGVFFSNADSNVQMQLKHPTHPKFLVAIVIDILTPNQDFGIFTFKHDFCINSKADLKRMYSLEELHKWAIESERTSFKPEDHRNIMQKAVKRIESHYGVELSNGTIIDMCQLRMNQDNELLAWVHGYISKKNGKTEYVLTSVSKNKMVSDNELLGCFITGTHCSIPTIKRMVSNDLRNMKFILFYSTSDDVLTSIPIIDEQLALDENCYGEEKLEELKIWTRRKR